MTFRLKKDILNNGSLQRRHNDLSKPPTHNDAPDFAILEDSTWTEEMLARYKEYIAVQEAKGAKPASAEDLTRLEEFFKQKKRRQEP